MKVTSEHLAIMELANIDCHETLKVLRVEPGGRLVATNGKLVVEVQVAGEEASTIEGTLSGDAVISAATLRTNLGWFDESVKEAAPFEIKASHGRLSLVCLTDSNETTFSSLPLPFPDYKADVEKATPGAPQVLVGLDADYLRGIADLIERSDSDGIVTIGVRGPENAVEFKWVNADALYRVVLMPLNPKHLPVMELPNPLSDEDEDEDDEDEASEPAVAPVLQLHERGE